MTLEEIREEIESISNELTLLHKELNECEDEDTTYQLLELKDVLTDDLDYWYEQLELGGK